MLRLIMIHITVAHFTFFPNKSYLLIARDKPPIPTSNRNVYRSMNYVAKKILVNRQVYTRKIMIPITACKLVRMLYQDIDTLERVQLNL